MNSEEGKKSFRQKKEFCVHEEKPLFEQQKKPSFYG